MPADDWARANQRADYGPLDPEAYAKQVEAEKRLDRAANSWLERHGHPSAQGKPARKRGRKRTRRKNP